MMRPICGLACCLLIACGDGLAADTPSADQTANKLTFAYYLFSSDKTGVDVNIRHTFETYEGDHTNRVPERIEKHVLPFFSNNLSFTMRK